MCARDLSPAFYTQTYTRSIPNTRSIHPKYARYTLYTCFVYAPYTAYWYIHSICTHTRIATIHVSYKTRYHTIYTFLRSIRVLTAHIIYQNAHLCMYTHTKLHCQILYACLTFYAHYKQMRIFIYLNRVPLFVNTVTQRVYTAYTLLKRPRIPPAVHVYGLCVRVSLGFTRNRVCGCWFPSWKIKNHIVSQSTRRKGAGLSTAVADMPGNSAFCFVYLRCCYRGHFWRNCVFRSSSSEQRTSHVHLAQTSHAALETLILFMSFELDKLN